jgi:hypothetical protein
MGLLAVAVFWCLPRKYGQDGVAAFTGLGLLVIAPATAIVMLSNIVLVQQAMVRSEQIGWRTSVTAVAIASLVAVFFLSREQAAIFGVQWLIIGIAYSTLRHIHVLAEWRLGRIAAPTLGAYFRYHLLPPVLAAGPIHRLPHFERQCERRRWSTTEFFSGAERALLGFALAVIVGEYLIGGKVAALLGSEPHRGFLIVWLASAIDWLRVYATFVGLTDIALGLCLMMGLRLEENFNKPWRARDLVGFWIRWHITLSLWCRDLVQVAADRDLLCDARAWTLARDLFLLHHLGGLPSRRHRLVAPLRKNGRPLAANRHSGALQSGFGAARNSGMAQLGAARHHGGHWWDWPVTPILAFLESYFRRRTSLIILCLLYAALIVSCCMVLNGLPSEPMRYLDLH